MTLYVTNLPPELTAEDLARLFAPFGRVAGVDIWHGRNGDTGLRAAVIDMHDGGREALAAVDGLTNGGRELAVSESRPWDPA
jgi:hypothetical protein